MGFLRGFLAPFRGAAYVSKERLWHFVLVPLLLNIALAGGAAYFTGRYWQKELADRAVGSPALATLLLVVTTVLGTVILFLILQPLLGAVFNDMLAERVERRATAGETPKVPLLSSVGASLTHGLLKLLLYGFAFVVALMAGTVTAGIGSLVGLALGGLFLAYDGFDFPLSRRGASFGAKWRYLALHPAQTIGYGLGATIFYLIPLALIVAPPLTAAGATLVYLETQKRAAEREHARNERRKEKVQPDEASPHRDGQG